jgi:RNase adapter protein RapZ
MTSAPIIDVILVAGVSGSGKSVALGALEDSEYFAVQNLPPAMLAALLKELTSAGYLKIAVSFDMRLANQFYVLPIAIRTLRRESVVARVLVLETKQETLIRRFSETRRHHPLAEKLKVTLHEAIAHEQDQLLPLVDLATRVDTSGLSSHALRTWVREWASSTTNQAASGLTLVFESFGYKYGVPSDADLVFDARMLPNPHYETGLAERTGRDIAVQNFLGPIPDVQRFIADVEAFVRKWLNAYQQDNRATLTVAIGCTGGQHRSVYSVEQLAKRFSTQGRVLTRHRQLPT